jgi:hypothetical protein
MTTACFFASKSHDALVHSTVGFMHRTVFEFLDNPHAWSVPSLRISDASFNANAAISLMGLHLARLLLLLLLLLPLPLEPTHRPLIVDSIKCARLAGNESPDGGFALLPKLKELADLLPYSRSMSH